jgi:hypothetical protein
MKIRLENLTGNYCSVSSVKLSKNLEPNLTSFTALVVSVIGILIFYVSVASSFCFGFVDPS